MNEAQLIKRLCADCKAAPATHIVGPGFVPTAPLHFGPRYCLPCATVRAAEMQALAQANLEAKAQRTICPACELPVHDGNPFEHDGRFWHRPCWFKSEERQQVASRVQQEPWDVEAHIEREQAPHSRSGWHTKKAKSTTVNGYTI